jgi:Carboxypeptidase regulatory-like domain/Cytochrome c554 and c-prime
MPRLLAIIVVVAVIGLPMWLINRLRPDGQQGGLAGEVRNEHGPVAGALVRIKGTHLTAITDAQGRFHLAAPSGPARITASKDGYFIGGTSTLDLPLVLRLERLPTEDCSRYEWVDPRPNRGERMNCGNCHKAMYEEWSSSGHARSATNRRLANLYDGTDWHGRPNVGWNLLKEHPDGASVCSSCHAPTQRSGPFSDFDLRDAARESPTLSGVHCDFCHKVQGPAEGEIGLTHGRYQLSLLRPATKERQIFFGPLDDVDRGEDVFSRFQRDSRLCASCHEGVVFGVPVYTTFSEWRASPAGAAGKSCQSCHMKPTGKMSNVAPGKGGIRRDPATLANHVLFAGSQREMLRGCLDLQATARRGAATVTLDLTLRADGVGHRVPTGYIDRQLILFVEAFAGNQPVPLISGPTLPDFLGKLEAGKPGRLFAKSLHDGNGQRPAPFWRADPASLIDTRLQSGVPESTHFAFSPGTDHIRIRLVHRRFWKTIADEKGWPTDELVVFEQEVAIQ